MNFRLPDLRPSLNMTETSDLQIALTRIMLYGHPSHGSVEKTGGTMSTIGGGLLGRTLMAVNGEKIGRIDALHVNSATGEPEWVAINLGGLIATKHGFAPVTEVTG